MDEQEHEKLHQVSEIAHSEYMALFEELSFKNKWKKVFDGLKQPKDTGAYKFARLQVVRLSAPTSGVVVPILALILLVILKAVAPAPAKPVEVRLIDPQKPPELEKPEEIKPPPDYEPIENDVPVNTISDVIAPPQDFSPQPAQIDSVAIVKSPVIMRGIFGSRSPGARGSARARYGGSDAAEAAVLRALRWLKKNQNTDGSWNKNQCAMTGFALLAYLAHGETPASEEFGQTVEKAIRFLVEHQQGDGRFSPRDEHDYTHPIATYAVCEAYGMTKVPMLKDAAEKAIAVVIQGQHPNGGFNYNLNNNNPRRNDSTYMSWCCQALKAAKMAGLETAGLDEAIKRSIDGWKVNMKGDANRATIGYTSPGDSGLTGAATLCLQLMGAGNDPLTKGGMMALQATTYNWEGGGTYNVLYYWYYITQAMFHTGGDVWTRWNALFSPVLVKNQIIEPKAIAAPNGEMVDIGHWAPERAVSGHTDEEGRVMNTCLCVLQLEVYYRYLPTFKQPEAADIQSADKPMDDVGIDVNI